MTDPDIETVAAWLPDREMDPEAFKPLEALSRVKSRCDAAKKLAKAAEKVLRDIGSNREALSAALTTWKEAEGA